MIYNTKTHHNRMCLAVPGKIIKIEGDVATVDYIDEQRQGKLVDEGYKVGDYVIIQGMIVIDKVPQKEAKAALTTYRAALDAS